MPVALRLSPIVAALLLAFGPTVREAKSAPVPDVRKDVYGDPLPPNAIARIGTVRLRVPHGARSPHDKFLATTGYYGLPVRSLTERGRVALSPNGKLLVTTGDYGVPLYVWNTETGRLLRVISTVEYQSILKLFDGDDHPRSVHESVLAIAFAPDSQQVRLMTNRGILRTCDVTTGKWSEALATTGLSAEELQKAKPVADVSPDGTHFAYVPRAKPHRIEVFAIGKDKPILQLKDDKFGDEGYFLDFSPDNKHLAVPLTDGTVKVWDLATGKVAATYSGPEDTRLQGATFAPNGKSIVGVFVPKKYHLDFKDDWTLVVWDTATGKERLRVPKWKGFVVGYTPDGSKLLSTTLTDRTGEVLIADAATGKISARVAHGDGHVCGLVPSADGKRLVTVGDDNAIVIWDLATGKPVHDLDGPRGWAYILALSPDGKTLLMGEPKNAAGLWDAQTGKRKHRLATDGKGSLMNGVFTTNGEQVVTGYSGDAPLKDKKVVARLWNVADGKQIREYSDRMDADRLMLSPDGKRILTKQLNNLVVFDFDTAKQLKEITGEKEGDAIHIYPKDGELIDVRLVHRQQFIATNVLSNKVVGKWQVGANSYLRAISPDGRLVALEEQQPGAGLDVMRIRRVADGEEVCKLPLEGVYYRNYVCFSPDNRTVAFTDGVTASLFDTKTAKELRELRGHTGLITGLVFSPDGTRLATASTDSTVLIWDLTAKP